MSQAGASGCSARRGAADAPVGLGVARRMRGVAVLVASTGTHVRVAASQAGVTPPQCSSRMHATQTCWAVSHPPSRNPRPRRTRRRRPGARRARGIGAGHRCGALRAIGVVDGAGELRSVVNPGYTPRRTARSTASTSRRRPYRMPPAPRRGRARRTSRGMTGTACRSRSRRRCRRCRRGRRRGRRSRRRGPQRRQRRGGVAGRLGRLQPSLLLEERSGLVRTSSQAASASPSSQHRSKYSSHRGPRPSSGPSSPRQAATETRTSAPAHTHDALALE